MPGGDYGVGYAWVMFFTLAIFWVCMALVAGIIGSGGGFAWLSLGRFASGGMLTLCFLVVLLGSYLGMEGSFRGIRWLARVNAVATPLILLVVFAVLLNNNLKLSVPPKFVKWGLASVVAVNGFMLATLLLGSLLSRAGAFLPRSSGKLDNFQLGILAQIDSCDVSKGVTSLFGYSGKNQPKQIREKALLKIKSKPDWQEDLIKALDSEYVGEAFGFLLANEVDDKPRIAKGVYQGLLMQAKYMRERLRRCSHPSHFYNGQFFFEIDESLEIVEKFKDQGVDFKPAIQEVRAALDEPIEFEFKDEKSKKMLDKWLNKH